VRTDRTNVSNGLFNLLFSSSIDNILSYPILLTSYDLVWSSRGGLQVSNKNNSNSIVMSCRLNIYWMDLETDTIFLQYVCRSFVDKKDCFTCIIGHVLN
jgi:hypothetical protein